MKVVCTTKIIMKNPNVIDVLLCCQKSFNSYCITNDNIRNGLLWFIFSDRHDTAIRISLREQDMVNDIYFPHQIQFQSLQGTSFTTKMWCQRFTSIEYNDYFHNIDSQFTQADNSLFLACDYTIIDSTSTLTCLKNQVYHDLHV
jgi:hypothetical protein